MGLRREPVFEGPASRRAENHVEGSEVNEWMTLKGEVGGHLFRREVVGRFKLLRKQE
jgi:hypothetical protein